MFFGGQLRTKYLAEESLEHFDGILGGTGIAVEDGRLMVELGRSLGS